jgi:hypothetical protein
MQATVDERDEDLALLSSLCLQSGSNVKGLPASTFFRTAKLPSLSLLPKGGWPVSSTCKVAPKLHMSDSLPCPIPATALSTDISAGTSGAEYLCTRKSSAVSIHRRDVHTT